MYVTLPINRNWVGNIQSVLSDYLLMLQKLFSRENVPLKTLQNLLQTSYTLFIEKEKTVTSKKIFKTDKW